MQNILHVVQIHHTFNYIVNDLENLVFGKLLIFLMNLVEKTAVFQIFSDQLVFVSRNAYSHVQNDIRMFKPTEDLQLFEKILLILMFSSFYIIFDRNRT